MHKILNLFILYSFLELYQKIDHVPIVSTSRNFITRKKFNQKYFYRFLKIVQIYQCMKSLCL